MGQQLLFISWLTCALFLLLIMMGGSIAANCGKFTAGDGSQYDISGLTKAGGYNYTAPGGGPNPITYAWNYCDVVPDYPDAPSCDRSSVTPGAFLINGTGQNRRCYVIGSSTNYTLLEGFNGPATGVQVQLKNGACQTILRVTCNPNTNFSFASVTASAPTCNFVLAVQTQLGCRLSGTGSSDAPGGGGGLSGGSIFLIVFFTVAGTYFILGTIIKWRLQHAPFGVESIPNNEFWSELPGYIADGFRFTKEKACGGYSRI